MGLKEAKAYERNDRITEALQELDNLKELSTEAKILKSSLQEKIGLFRESLAFAETALEEALANHEFVDQNDLPVAKDMETLSPKKSVDRGAGRKHVFVRREVIVTRKRMATSNKDC